eukprot:Nk52_evm1s680 gene=Nk52_evmTU1s680
MERIKQSDYADDIAIMSSNERDRRRAVRLIEKFCSISGMELNYGKCIVIPFGSKYALRRENTDGMQWLRKDKVTKCLGHYIGCKQRIADEKTRSEKMAQVDAILERWKVRKLS